MFMTIFCLQVFSTFEINSPFHQKLPWRNITPIYFYFGEGELYKELNRQVAISIETDDNYRVYSLAAEYTIKTCDTMLHDDTFKAELRKQQFD